MLLKKSFSKFLKDRVNLNQSRIDRIVSSHHSVRDKLAEDGWVSDHLVRTRLQGSYALETAIRSPHESGTYDVDVVLGLKLMRSGGLPSGYSVLKKTRDALEAVPLYSGKTEILRCCVRVDYAHDGLDFHLDVVPTHVPDEMSDPLQIPREWDKTNPIGYINWFNDQNRKTSGYLRKVVRLLKYWRDLQQLESPNSMVLTTLAGQFIPGNARSVDDALVHVLGRILEWTENNADQSAPPVLNPLLLEENLARNWNYSQFLKFRDHLKPAYRDAKKALDSKEEEEAINLWNGSHLFNGKFPTELSNPGKKYRDISNDFSEAAVSVGSIGRIGEVGVIPSYNRGYHGNI